MTDKLIAYCPEIQIINDPKTHYSFLDDEEREDLIAAALRREIIKRGEFYAFKNYAHDVWNTDDSIECPDTCDAQSWFIEWLTDPETFIRVAGEWVGNLS